MAKKILKSFRLSSRTNRDIDMLAKRWHVTQTDVLTVLVRVASDMGSILDENEELEEMLDMVRRVREL